MSISSRVVNTTHGDIAIDETSGGGLPVLFIHGNSICKEIFARQLNSDLGDGYRLIAMDLPGHGASSDAGDPERTYTMPGYADAAVALLGELGIDRAVVVGWSLGGNVALEMLPRFPGLVGLLIAAAPPIGPGMEALQQAYRPSPHVGLTGKPDFTPEEVEIFVRATTGEPVDPAMRQAILRADGRARTLMFTGLLAGNISNQRALAEGTEVPIAVVNGAEDPLVNVDYVGEVAYGNLWNEHCYLLRGAGHASFWQAPDAFNPILGRFLDDMQARATRIPAGGSTKGAVA
jgi:pimeloyl-ACP methyl ester carboxylesterase